MCKNLILFKEGKRKDEKRKISNIYRRACRPAAQQPASFSRHDGFKRRKHSGCSN